MDGGFELFGVGHSRLATLVPGSPCRTGPAGIEQIRSLVSVVLHTDTYQPGRQVFRFSHHTPVLPGGLGHRQITQNRPYKNKFCGGKFKAVSRQWTGRGGSKTAQNCSGREGSFFSREPEGRGDGSGTSPLYTETFVLYCWDNSNLVASVGYW